MVVVTIIGAFTVVVGTMGMFAIQVIAQGMSSNETMMMEGGNMTKDGR
jgi:hypothetical protein